MFRAFNICLCGSTILDRIVDFFTIAEQVKDDHGDLQSMFILADLATKANYQYSRRFQ